jgi:hypothetical protein
MKHATPDTLASLNHLLQQLRDRERLVERTPGAFYFRSKAFLHFHYDPSGIYADVKQDLINFTRMRCTSRQEQENLLHLVDRALAESGKQARQHQT